MTLEEAKRIIAKFYRNPNPTEEQAFVYTEAMQFIIRTTNDPDYMLGLGGYYYGLKNYELALKYYEMAADLDFEDAFICLGYVWYYGRTGTKDYKKAFEYFSRGMAHGSVCASYKVADMYKNGYYVEKDHKKYKDIIEDLYERVKDSTFMGDCVADVCMRLAKIRVEEGKKEEAVDLYLHAKHFEKQSLERNAFFGDLNVMDWLIHDLYKLIDIDEDDLDYFDLYVLLEEPKKVRFRYDRKVYTVESVIEDGTCVVKFGDKWFRSAKEFVEKAMIGRTPLVSINTSLYGFEVV